MQPNPIHAPAPEGWPRPKRSARLVFAVGYLGLFALGMFAGSAWAVYTDQIGAAVLLLFGGLGFGHLAGLAAGQLRLPQGEGRATTGTTDDGEIGLTYTYARAPYYWLITTLALVTLASLGVTALGLLAAETAGWVVAAIAAASAGWLLWLLILVVRLAPGRVVLTPTGVYHRSLTFEHFVPWWAVTEVVADQEAHPVIAVKAYPSEGTRRSGRFGTYEGRYLPIMVIRSYRLGANTLPAFQALHHYFHNADQRAQLSAPPRTFNNEA
ncbi:hypothetical protein [Actinoplanes sp. M2I2]|uniref:hypothetical protein n=1 Tax=Actinoplanes sp. M2I2 TaxID=1734444 RepID=UPI00202192BE|nr:hypothetical protein [Actinoplanes sp. M2I2]